MRRGAVRRHGLAAAAAFLVAVGGIFPATAQAIDESDKPNLKMQLPDQPRNDQVAPVYMDTFEISGQVLYRFDGVISNRGGTLDLYRDTSTGHALQALWPGGTPSPLPDPNLPPGGDAVSIDLSSSGGEFVYITSDSDTTPGTDGHNHWHFMSAARYELLTPDGPRVQPKVSFCMYDSWGGGTYFAPNYRGSGPTTWCAPHTSTTSFVRMGLSPGGNDNYRSQVPFQWIDVSGLSPGEYRLRATANPYGIIDESTREDNTLEVMRVIPGTTARSFEVDATTSELTTLTLSGTIVGPGIPARASAACKPSRSSSSCYVFAAPDGPLAFTVVRPPAHGTLELGPAKNLEATAGYTPDPGFTGDDSFTYVVADERKLTSSPAEVTLHVRATRPANVALPAVSGSASVGSRLSATAGEWRGSTSLVLAYQWFRCGAAGSDCTAIGRATGASYLVRSRDVGRRLEVRVTASDGGGSERATSLPTSAVEVARPTLRRAGGFFARGRSVRLHWHETTESLAWLDSYQLRVRSLQPDGGMSKRRWLTGTTKTQATFVGVPGVTHCFRVRAVDRGGHTSPWSAERCRALPRDDRALARTGGWQSVADPTALGRTLSVSRRFGASIRERGRSIRSIAVLASKCPKCGALEIRAGGKKLARASLFAASWRPRRIVAVTVPNSAVQGAIVVRVASHGKRIPLDGLFLSPVTLG